MRSSSGMTGGTPLQSGVINLANNQNVDVSYISSFNPINLANINASNSSLYQTGSTGTVNIASVNMSVVDRPGATSSYYSIRVNTDIDPALIYYGCVKITALLLNQ
jgi:hypothetical protein